MRRRRVMVLVAAALVAGACTRDGDGSASTAPTGIPVHSEPVTSAAQSTAPATIAVGATSTTIRTSPLTPTDARRISAEQRAAIERLARTSAGPPEHAEAHAHGADVLEYPLFTGDAAVLADEWLRARASTARVDTIAEAAALGYVRAAVPGSGVGTHWVLWSQIAEPFDVTRPAMLLFDERSGVPQLAGYSYWIQSAQPPAGFAGPLDVWHQHDGYCIVNGWVDRENVAGPQECAGDYLPGGDLWMLHAWVVPGWENPAGRFAVFSRRLCPPPAAPDVLRCPDD